MGNKSLSDFGHLRVTKNKNKIITSVYVQCFKLFSMESS